MDFDILEDIASVETIASGRGIRELKKIESYLWKRSLEKKEGNC
jgi:hypothetical protein